MGVKTSAGWLRASARALVATGAAWVASTALAGAPPLSEPGPVDPLVEPLLKPTMYSDMAMSPDGRRIAALAWTGAMNVVVVLDLAAHKRTMITNARLTRLDERKEEAQPTQVWWLDDDMLAVNFRGIPAQAYSPDGKPLRELGRRVVFQGRENGRLSDWVLVARDASSLESLARVNARTGERQPVRLDAPGSIVDWTADAGGTIRMLETISSSGWTPNARLAHWYRATGSAPWVKLDEHGIGDPDWQPLVVPPGDGPVLMLAHNGHDTLALWRYDPVRRAFGDRVAGDDADDIVGVRTHLASGELQAVLSDGLVPKTTWLDPRMTRLQRAVDDVLPGRLNAIRLGDSGDALVHSMSDRDPGRWFAYDGKTRQLELVGVRRADIDPARMAPMQALRYRAPDGVEVPAYLTLPGASPRPARPLPLVVLVHDGPQTRTQWGWDRDVQAFAAHGYAVLQPQFRGSSGFGRRFEQAGVGQWGLAMQDDITAGVRDLAARGVADPARVCIVGEGFGGYAAMWGLAKDPDLYRCGISIDGIHDLPRMVADVSSPTLREWIRTHIGDLAQLETSFPEVSPVRHADRIKSPVLLIHRHDAGNGLQEQAWLMQEALADHHHPDVQMLRLAGPESDAEVV